MNRLPDPQQPTTTAGQPTINTQAQQFLAAVEQAMQTPTAYRDDTPTPAIGTTPPVPQPGRPPMSQKATDTSALMLSAGAAALPIGAAATGILWASGNADPTVIGLICAAPVALAVPILALTRLMNRAKQAAAALPPEHHHHYSGPVHQDHTVVTTQTRGVWAKTRNELPR